LEQRRRRSGARDRILDAAADLVGEIGAGRVTLDAVAERAGLSKGGLLYHFPNKDALLQGMIERMVDEAVAEKDQLRGETDVVRNREAYLSVAATLERACDECQVANGLLAALAENPRLLDPVRRVVSREWEALKTNSDDPEAALVAWLAAQGLSALAMHEISPLDDADRERVAAALFRLLEKGIAS